MASISWNQMTTKVLELQSLEHSENGECILESGGGSCKSGFVHEVWGERGLGWGSRTMSVTLPRSLGDYFIKTWVNFYKEICKTRSPLP